MVCVLGNRICSSCEIIELAKAFLDAPHCQHAIAHGVQEAWVHLIAGQPLLKELPPSVFLR